MKTLEELQSISDLFFEKCEQEVSNTPYAVCIAMHHYARHLYPEDPYIEFQKHTCPTERLYSVTCELIDYLETSKRLGFYGWPAINKNQELEVKEATGKVYGKFWSEFELRDLVDGALDILKERFCESDFDPSKLGDMQAIDIGCGSGRFSLALSKWGCAYVTGVDYGDDGLAIAKAAKAKLDMQNVTFQKASVLELPFEDETFDFVYCNGVLHHTEDMEKGIDEMIRVAKRGALIWFYIYADGGIFWHARRKMPRVMKRIPQDYTMKVLNMIGMPSTRFIFADNWYVPIERHTTDAEARSILEARGIKQIQRLEKGRSTDLDYHAIHGGAAGKIMWGDGELRYFLKKEM